MFKNKIILDKYYKLIVFRFFLPQILSFINFFINTFFLNDIFREFFYKNKKYILITLYRRENWGQPMKETLIAVKDYLKEHEDLYLVFPMRLNSVVRNVVHKVLDDFDRKILLEPLEYLGFIAVMDGAHYIMTDSGGVQEEAPSLGKPTLVLKNTTERPEAIEVETAKLVGIKYETVIKYMKLLEGELYHQMAKANNSYGDGKTFERRREYLEFKREQRWMIE